MRKSLPFVQSKSRKKRLVEAFYLKGVVAEPPNSGAETPCTSLAREYAGIDARDTQLASNWEWEAKIIEWEHLIDSLQKNGSLSADLIKLSQVTPARERRDYTWLAGHAMRNGAVVTNIGSIRWDIYGDCSNPYMQTFRAPPRYAASGRLERRCAFYIDIQTRCRKCDNCLRHRAALWRIRATSEYQNSVRTWFGTLTLSPARLYYYKLAARQTCARKRQDFDKLTEKERFAALHREVSVDLTKALKRLRKNTGVPFKYLIVAEAHKSGEPHYHLLFHEKNVNSPLRYVALRSFWPHGFTQYKLVVDAKQATYLCKYLSKSLMARVRASQRYGSEAVDSL